MTALRWQSQVDIFSVTGLLRIPDVLPNSHIRYPVAAVTVRPLLFAKYICTVALLMFVDAVSSASEPQASSLPSLTP
jgi:hypothetical protein